MPGENVSAIAAMNALRGQIEERLFLTEDYRALKAIERAITDVLSPTSTKLNNLSAILNSLTNGPSSHGGSSSQGGSSQKIA